MLGLKWFWILESFHWRCLQCPSLILRSWPFSSSNLQIIDCKTSKLPFHSTYWVPFSSSNERDQNTFSLCGLGPDGLALSCWINKFPFNYTSSAKGWAQHFFPTSSWFSMQTHISPSAFWPPKIHQILIHSVQTFSPFKLAQRWTCNLERVNVYLNSINNL